MRTALECDGKVHTRVSYYDGRRSQDFFHHIDYDLEINFHPDDDFKDYVSYETGERTMNDEQAELYNRLMDEAFEVCEGDQVYEIGCELLFERLQIE